MTEKPTWRKSSHSGGTGNDECVELLITSDQVSFRDSKAPQNGLLAVPPGAFNAFLDRLREPGQSST